MTSSDHNCIEDWLAASDIGCSRADGRMKPRGWAHSCLRQSREVSGYSSLESSEKNPKESDADGHQDLEAN